MKRVIIISTIGVCLILVIVFTIKNEKGKLVAQEESSKKVLGESPTSTKSLYKVKISTNEEHESNYTKNESRFEEVEVVDLPSISDFEDEVEDSISIPYGEYEENEHPDMIAFQKESEEMFALVEMSTEDEWNY